jgi:amidohydrolase
MSQSTKQELFTSLARRLRTVLNELYDLACEIHSNPEIAFNEFKASALCAQKLSSWGFIVEKPFCELETAFRAHFGNGSKKIAFLAEYDALPNIGHACGHNLIAAISLGAAYSLMNLTNELDVELNVIGTPAEEGGGGKIILMERGGFDGINIAMLVHPSAVDAVHMNTKALSQFSFTFYGKEAHASSAPYEGINALDAMVTSLTAISLLRQQLKPSDQIHGIITDGGSAPNVIPAKTSAHYIARSDSLEGLKELEEKLFNCFRAGALATNAKLNIEPIGKVYSHFNINQDLLDLLEVTATNPLINRNPEKDPSKWFSASTDMANLSWKIPCVHPTIKVECGSAVNHQPDFAQACLGESAKKAIYDGANWLSFFSVELVQQKFI